MSYRLFPILGIFLLTAPNLWPAAPPPAAATAFFEDEITVTASGQEEPSTEVPAAVTVITRRELEDAQTESVADALRQVPGLNLATSGGQGSATSLFTRGTESDHTLVLFDGIRLNSPFFAGYDWSQATTAGLERIEVARGPYSALWGADAIGGVVNMIPRRATDELSAELFAEGGEDGWRRGQGSFSYSANSFDLMASGMYREGEDALPNSDYQTTDLLLDAGWSWAPSSRVAILVQDLEAETGIPFSGATMTPNRRQWSRQRIVATPVQWAVSDAWQLDFNLAQVNRDFEFADPNDPWGYTESATSADTLQSRLASHHDLGDHTLSWGGEWRRDEVSNSSSYGVNLDGQQSDTTSLFVQDSWRLHDSLRLIGGVRWDDTEEWGSELSPRLNLGWEINPMVELRLGYGQAFRQPSVGELFFPSSGNPDLRAETSDSYELGVVVSPAGRGLLVQASFFRTELAQLIDFDYASYAFANTAEATVTGAELGLQMVLKQDLSAGLQLSFLDTEGDDGLPLLRRPEWSASATLNGRVWRRLSSSLWLRFVGERDDVDAVSFQRVRAPSFFTADLALAWQLRQGVELTLRAVNLADESYEEVAGYPAPGRRLIGGFRIGL